MTVPRIRPIVVGIIRRGGDIFVFEGRDPVTGEVFYRPLGGGIEFGESGGQALVREMREELGAEIVDVHYLATIENIFTFGGAIGHEIVQVYEAKLLDRSLYEQETLPAHEDDGTPFIALWKPLDEFLQGDATLYPDGLLNLLGGSR